jgi:hypothetical protein
MKNLRQFLAFAVMACTILFVQAKDIIGNSDLQKDSRAVGTFQQINVNADFDIIIDYAITPKVEVEAESNLQEVILTEVKGKALNISIAKRTKIINNFPIVIRVALPMLTKIQYNGNGNITADGIPSDKMEMILNGKGTLNFKNLKTSSMKLTLSQGFKMNINDAMASGLNLTLKDNTSCNITTLSGVKSTTLTFASTEACTFSGLSSESLTLKGTGAGNLTFNGFVGKKFTANMTSSGNVTLTGNADEVSVTCASSASFDAMSLPVKKAKAVNNGSGVISVSAASNLDATISASGKIIYAGTPKIKIQNTGTGQLEKKN